MNLIERFEYMMREMNLSPSEFADKINVQRSAISHITSGRNKPSLEFILKIREAFPDISIEWLISGEGKMKKDDSYLEIEEKENNSTFIESSTPTLFDDQINVQNEELNAKKENKEAESESIQKIIILYNNGKFEEFSPKN